MNVRTLPDLHQKYPEALFGKGFSLLIFRYNHTRFMYGYVFQNLEKFKEKTNSYQIVKIEEGDLKCEVVIEPGTPKNGYAVEELFEYINGAHSNNFYQPELRKRKLIDEKRSSRNQIPAAGTIGIIPMAGTFPQNFDRRNTITE